MAARDIIEAVRSGALDHEDALDVLTGAPSIEVDAALTAALSSEFSRLFGNGWQPAELHRAVARRGNPIQARLVADAARDYARGRSPVDERWQAQADTLRTPEGRRPDRIAVLDASLALLAELRRMPRIDILIPPPGTPLTAVPHHGDQRILDRVRALLAKAEATDFPAEAESYSAKAQELITRYRIEVVAAPAVDVTPFARRIGVDHPYESEKAGLLDAVAQANTCRTVWSPELGFSTIFGFDADIDAVELLYTSLLVQANRAMVRDEKNVRKARLKAFKRSFLVAYGVRIGERLRQVTEREMTGHGDLLPVLRRREVQVHEAMDRAFPRTVRARGSRVESLEGWESGRAAADEAELR
ncbi:hypothetical protein FHR83_007897 [Actinoplanes campanulatus]|uniref:DUF2786 domain-containing protein n=1 Tax=Actinoplanes campanulatus TaxID=113559 RepID=A0A7W5AQ69_9ACTN|nr:DUF2786 domain-containing protein [Actinoplanes campanulatus]MBB3100177.1 hypothetical protein [Actinoplanes campanulatus]GGN28685.1 hypothetical protein GCM10010109_47120 [Actinoplanes campanulatus]GID39012.1 hypothetical protein Aca09nite_55180 [Actinoplanes campanulatus]